MRMDGQTKEEGKSSSSYNFKEGREMSAGEDTFMTPLQGFGMGKTTSPAQVGMTHGVTAGGTGAVTKEFVIKRREAMIEEMTRLEMEMRHYEIMLKRAKVEAMKVELEKLSPEKIFLSRITIPSGGDLIPWCASTGQPAGGGGRGVNP